MVCHGVVSPTELRELNSKAKQVTTNAPYTRSTNVDMLDDKKVSTSHGTISGSGWRPVNTASSKNNTAPPTTNASKLLANENNPTTTKTPVKTLTRTKAHHAPSKHFGIFGLNVKKRPSQRAAGLLTTQKYSIRKISPRPKLCQSALLRPSKATTPKSSAK
jgi:hypothetical protein